MAPSVVNVPPVKVGELLPFFGPFSTANPKFEGVAKVTAVNKNGTVNVKTTDEHATPYASVPVIAPGAEHPANGPFVVNAPRTAPKKSRAKPKGLSGLKRKLPPAKKKAKK